jgi:hypothetical protein
MNLAEQQRGGSAIPFSEAQLQGADWDTLNQLAYQYQREASSVTEPLQLADASALFGRSDGVSFQTKRALHELDKEFFGTASEPVAPVRGYSPGKDTQMIEDYKARTAEAKREEGIKLLMKMRGYSRQQAEQFIK